jgi:crotonobetainyl-CoA:carnitine CoA-transferase CaiB-like acyl-CoA transferase
MRLPLDGIRILDFTMLLPGPWCTLFLADFGAEVIKIEEPKKGDYVRWFPPFIKGISARHLLINRNKKSMILNLKTDQGKKIAHQLVETADALVEGFRPGVMGRLGLGYKELSKINPKIIYCSISGYGQDGPYKNVVGHDINYLGYSGILSITGEADGPPVLPGVQISDISSGGMMAAIAVLIALIARSKTGKGQYIDISMLDGNVAQLYATAGDYFATALSPERGETTESRVLGGYACYSIYKTQDSKYITVGPLEEKFWATLCGKLGREDLIEIQFVPEKQVEIKSALQEIFLKKTRDEWVEEFRNLDVCVGPVNTMEEAFEDPQIASREMVTEMEHPHIGKVPQLGIPINFSEFQGKIRRPAPSFGEHTAEILKELGYNGKTIKALMEGGK